MRAFFCILVCYLYLVLMFEQLVWCFTQFGGSFYRLNFDKFRKTALFRVTNISLAMAAQTAHWQSAYMAGI